MQSSDLVSDYLTAYRVLKTFSLSSSQYPASPVSHVVLSEVRTRACHDIQLDGELAYQVCCEELAGQSDEKSV